MKRGGAVDRRDRVPRTDDVRHLALELVDERPGGGDPAAGQRFGDHGALGLADLGHRKGHCALGGRGSGSDLSSPDQFRYLGSVWSATTPAPTTSSTSSIPSGTVRETRKPRTSRILSNDTR